MQHVRSTPSAWLVPGCPGNLSFTYITPPNFAGFGLGTPSMYLYCHSCLDPPPGVGVKVNTSDSDPCVNWISSTSPITMKSEDPVLTSTELTGGCLSSRYSPAACCVKVTPEVTIAKRAAP